MLDLLFLVVMILFLSALCSCTEAAIASVPVMRVRQLAEGKSRRALALLKLKTEMHKASNTIVILNNLVNIGGSALVTAQVIALFGNKWLAVCSGVLTFLVIIFAEIIPKTIGYNYPGHISLWVSMPLYWLSYILAPVLYAVNSLTLLFSRKQHTSVTERDVLSIVSAAFQDGKISANEYRIARRAFALNDTKAGQIVTPRTVLTYLYGHKTIGEYREKIISSPHSRIPVMGTSIDHVMGMVLKQQVLVALIRGEDDKLVSEFCHKVLIINENMRADELLTTFTEKKQHLAVVFDEYGGLKGVVTLEDILEELMGTEIVDETDKVVDMESWAKKKGKEKFTG